MVWRLQSRHSMHEQNTEGPHPHPHPLCLSLSLSLSLSLLLMHDVACAIVGVLGVWLLNLGPRQSAGFVVGHPLAVTRQTVDVTSQ